jgi:hypothetical protein
MGALLFGVSKQPCDQHGAAHSQFAHACTDVTHAAADQNVHGVDCGKGFGVCGDFSSFSLHSRNVRSLAASGTSRNVC